MSWQARYEATPTRRRRAHLGLVTADARGAILTTMARDKLWNYARIARIWAWALIASAPAMLILGALVEMGDPRDGMEGSWVPIALASFASALVIFFFVLRVWMRPSAVPTGRLQLARPEKGRQRLLEAGARDWRVWSTILFVLVIGAGFVMMGFLVGVLGGGGMPEGVVAGVMAAWGLVTLEDVRQLHRIEHDEGRTYYAACRRPVSVGDTLVWRRREASTSAHPDGSPA